MHTVRQRILVLLALAVASILLTSACGLSLLGTGRSSQTRTPTATPFQAPRPAPSASIEADLRSFREVLEILSTDHIDRQNLNLERLKDAGIRGMIQALNDPHTAYIDAENYRVGRSDLSGSFEGIGAQVADRQGEIVIVSPIPGSPAERSGLRSGDVILEVNGGATKGKSLLEVVALIRGPRGTAVTLTIQRPGNAQPQKFTIVREAINLDSVAWRQATEDIALVRISYFSQRTVRELEEALRLARTRGAKGIVLDLRGNPGGLLDASVRAASHFLPSGTVVYEVNADGTERPWAVSPGGLATNIPLAVLVDEGSASGAEVVAGALQDARRAPLIGTKTFGKGSVNIVRELSDGSALYVTFGRWLTPARHQIEGKGLTPDIEVARTPGLIEKEGQLVQSLKERLDTLDRLNEGGLRTLVQDLQTVVDGRLQALQESAGRELPDAQLQRAIEYLRTGK